MGSTFGFTVKAEPVKRVVDRGESYLVQGVKNQDINKFIDELNEEEQQSGQPHKESYTWNPKAKGRILVVDDIHMNIFQLQSIIEE